MPIATTTVINTEVHERLATELDRNRAARCLTYWRIGRQLNLEYGSPDSSWIPGRDMEKLTDIYRVPPNYISAFRRFAAHAESDTVTRAQDVIATYKSWNGINTRFLRGLSPDAPVRVPQQASAPAGFVVPEAAVDRFAARFGVSHVMAQKMMREYAHDTDWLVNVFSYRAQRDGHKVTVP